MNGDSVRRWRRFSAAALLIWLFFAARLMIADVWDESNGILFFGYGSRTLVEKLGYVLTESLGFWRPLPSLPLVAVIHFVHDFDVSWRLLRSVNIALLLGTLIFLLDTVRLDRRNSGDTNPDPRLEAAFLVAFLFSGSAVITAGWFANVFDASALFLIAIALRLLFLRRAVAAGVVIGLAFFCKESAALALPFLVVLFAARRINGRELLQAGVPATALGALYFALRSRVVPLGGSTDIHGFDPALALPTLYHLAHSFWLQNLKGTLPAVFGLLLLVASLAALRRVRMIAAACLFLVACVVVYLGMFVQMQGEILISHLNFVGRLYLIPVALMLFLLALERRTATIALLCVAIVSGGYSTWRDHARFQRTYKRIYRTASEATVKPLRVHYPLKPLGDEVRGIDIGDHPDAPVIINQVSGGLFFR